MRIVTDEERQEISERNKDAVSKMKSQLVRNIGTLNRVNSIVKSQKNIVTAGLDLFLDEKGNNLAASTVALNMVGLGLEFTLELWNEWRDYNKRFEEYNETLRRYGITDMANYTDMSRNIFSGKISGKRRY